LILLTPLSVGDPYTVLLCPAEVLIAPFFGPTFGLRLCQFQFRPVMIRKVTTRQATTRARKARRAIKVTISFICTSPDDEPEHRRRCL
jgi:hypothetical protein